MGMSAASQRHLGWMSSVGMAWRIESILAELPLNLHMGDAAPDALLHVEKLLESSLSVISER